MRRESSCRPIVPVAVLADAPADAALVVAAFGAAAFVVPAFVVPAFVEPDFCVAMDLQASLQHDSQSHMYIARFSSPMLTYCWVVGPLERHSTSPHCPIGV